MEGRCLSADAHLALLGVNYSGNGILGLRKIKKQREIAASFHVTGNYRKDRLRCSVEFKNARTEAGMITRKALD